MRLDEPMAGVRTEDVSGPVELILRVHRAQGMTAMVEHHIDVILTLADRLAVMHHGGLLACDTPRCAAPRARRSARPPQRCTQPAGCRLRRAAGWCDGAAGPQRRRQDHHPGAIMGLVFSSGDLVLEVLPQFHVEAWNVQPLLAV